MATFTYKARDAEGKLIAGSMETGDKAELIDRLRKTGHMVTYVAEKVPGGVDMGSLLSSFRRVGDNEMLVFFIQFANMINSGISILSGLSMLAQQTGNRNLKKALLDIISRVEAGDSLSKAFAGHPRLFSNLFINMVKAGEVSGKLDTVLLRYASFFEQQVDLKEKVSSALLYPLILLCAGVAVVLFIVTVVIPQFAEIYMKANIRLPIPTLIVFRMGTAIKRYWYVLIASLIVIILTMRWYMKTEKGTLIFDRLKLNLPVVGPLHRKVAIARFTRTLATLSGSGVPILESLDATKEVLGNVILEGVMADAARKVEKGDRIADPLKKSGEFPPDVTQMIAAGEESGNLDGMLNKIADFYDMIVGYAVKRLSAVIEPLFLVVMGSMVGFIMASMLMPIFDMVKTLKR